MHSFIPDMSYLDWFAPKRSFSSYWYCSPQPGLEMAYNKLLSCCLSLAKKGLGWEAWEGMRESGVSRKLYMW